MAETAAITASIRQSRLSACAARLAPASDAHSRQAGPHQEASPGLGDQGRRWPESRKGSRKSRHDRHGKFSRLRRVVAPKSPLWHGYREGRRDSEGQAQSVPLSGGGRLAMAKPHSASPMGDRRPWCQAWASRAAGPGTTQAPAFARKGRAKCPEAGEGAACGCGFESRPPRHLADSMRLFGLVETRTLRAEAPSPLAFLASGYTRDASTGLFADSCARLVCCQLEHQPSMRQARVAESGTSVPSLQDERRRVRGRSCPLTSGCSVLLPLAPRMHASPFEGD